MPNGSWPGIVISYLGFLPPAGIFFHSKIASPGAIARPVRNASFHAAVSLACGRTGVSARVKGRAAEMWEKTSPLHPKLVGWMNTEDLLYGRVHLPLPPDLRPAGRLSRA